MRGLAHGNGVSPLTKGRCCGAERDPQDSWAQTRAASAKAQMDGAVLGLSSEECDREPRAAPYKKCVERPRAPLSPVGAAVLLCGPPPPFPCERATPL